MNLRFVKPVVLAFALLSSGGNVMSNTDATANVGRFDFAYSISGDPRARPIQVFDDGSARTYFQFRPGTPLPAFFTATGDLLLPRQEGPYVVVDSRARDFILAIGLVRARVVHAAVLSGLQPSHTGARAAGRTPGTLIASAAGGLPPGALSAAAGAGPARWDAGDLTQSSYATPIKGDVVEWQEQGRTVEQPVLFVEGSSAIPKAVRRALVDLAGRIGSDARVTVVGREDASLKEGLAEARARALRDVLISAGVPAPNIVAQIGVESGEPIVRGKVRLVASTIRWTPTRAPRLLEGPNRSTATRADALHASGVTGPAETVARLLADNKISAEMAKRILDDLKLRDPQLIKRTQGEYSIRREDKDIAAAVARWASRDGYELIWDAPKAAVTGDMTLRGESFLDAVRQVVNGLQQAGYPIQATAYSDKVVRVTIKKESTE